MVMPRIQRLLFVHFVALALLVAFASRAQSATEYWELPTGSRIAYLKFPARGQRQPHPIVFLHGGPGSYAVTIEPTTRVMSKLTDDGFDVYIYDQVGGGLSERLSDITEYSVARHVADLEAVRQLLGADKLILIGSSWGAQLTARYVARYENRVARAVLVGPGALHPADWRQVSYGRLEERFTPEEMRELQALINRPEVEKAVELVASDPAAALRTFPDKAADHMFDEVSARFFLPHLGCAGTRYTFNPTGYGFWANRMTGRDLDQSPDPKPALRKSEVQTLILRGECEYMKPEVAQQYRDVLRNSVLVNIPRAGHTIFWDQPEAFLDAVRRFLRRP
jgi:pimeloyl-ACP methyl ester carboxylesterase